MEVSRRLARLQSVLQRAVQSLPVVSIFFPSQHSQIKKSIVESPRLLQENNHGHASQGRRLSVAGCVLEQMEPLLPPRKPHPLGCHDPRVSDRAAMNAIYFVRSE